LNGKTIEVSSQSIEVKRETGETAYTQIPLSNSWLGKAKKQYQRKHSQHEAQPGVS